MGFFSNIVNKVKAYAINGSHEKRKYLRTKTAYEMARHSQDLADFCFQVEDSGLYQSCQVYAQRHNLDVEIVMARMYKGLVDKRIEPRLETFDKFEAWDNRIKERKIKREIIDTGYEMERWYQTN